MARLRHIRAGRGMADIVARMTARRPDEVRYAWSNNPESGLICDGDGMLIPPFRLTLPTDDDKGIHA